MRSNFGNPRREIRHFKLRHYPPTRRGGGQGNEVRGVHHRGGVCRGGLHGLGIHRQHQAADHPGGGAWLRGHVARGAPLRALWRGRSAEPHPARRGPRGADVEDSHRTDGEHRPVVAPHTARRGPRHAGQHDRGPRGGRLRQGHLALRGPAVPSQRRPSQRQGEQGAVPGDGGYSAEDMDRRVLLAPGRKLHLPRRRHGVLPSKVPIGPRLAGRRQGDEAAGDAQALPGAAPAAVDDRLHRPLRHDRRRAWAEGMLLAAPAPQDQAANGALRPGQER